MRPDMLFAATIDLHPPHKVVTKQLPLLLLLSSSTYTC